MCTRAGGEEGPGTKTVLAQCVAIYQFGLYLARALQPDKKQSVEDILAELETAPDRVHRMLSGQTAEDIEELASRLAADQILYLVGAGPFSALALQAANFLREVSKLHCYAFEAMEFRHGPLEVLSNRSRLLVLSNSSCRASDQVARACQAATKAGVSLVYVGDREGRPGMEFDAELVLPEASEILAALLYLAPLQLLGFHIAKQKGLDAGRLTNIVKTWTE